MTPRGSLPRRIVIPLANPRTAADLVRIGAALVAPGGTLTALSIVEVAEGMPLSEGATRARQARRLLQRVLEFTPDGVDLRTVVRIGPRRRQQNQERQPDETGAAGRHGNRAEIVCAPMSIPRMFIGWVNSHSAATPSSSTTIVHGAAARRGRAACACRAIPATTASDPIVPSTTTPSSSGRTAAGESPGVSPYRRPRTGHPRRAPAAR